MNFSSETKSKSMITMAIIALIFGLATIYSGADVIFLDGAGRERAGDYIDFIVWFNFLAGFVYILAAYGLYKSRQWSVILSKTIAIATLIAFGALGIYIFKGFAYETRTLVAMILRCGIWIIIAYISTKHFKAKTT
ncbi:MAG: hypothetical protein HRU29_15920 [Rhizobiales bacterium]|nr:hypothetical protein [Hyphomicrobiales bacterium]NRB15883.1 hypothetical protein [Hyphomicrobiales bacterium]